MLILNNFRKINFAASSSVHKSLCISQVFIMIGDQLYHLFWSLSMIGCCPVTQFMHREQKSWLCYLLISCYKPTCQITKASNQKRNMTKKKKTKIKLDIKFVWNLNAVIEKRAGDGNVWHCYSLRDSSLHQRNFSEVKLPA